MREQGHTAVVIKSGHESPICIPTDVPATNQRTAPLRNNEDIYIINYLCLISRALRGPARSPGAKP
jgi:hypothetical protein